MKILFIAALLVSLCIAGPVPTSPSLCDTYSAGNGTKFMDGFIGAVLGDVAASSLSTFFDGSIAGVDFLTNSSALNILASHLVEFFGSAGALNCTIGPVPAYQGNPNMLQVHAPFPITLTSLLQFNNIIINLAATSGVSASDQDRLRVMLNQFRYQVCNTGATCNPGSICDKYSIALNLSNTQLITTVVTGVINGAVGSSLKNFFDGSIPGTTDFLTDAPALATLTAHLVEFFAETGVLDCTDGGIGAYAGQSLVAAHANLPITLADFNQFNQIVLSVMGGAGVSSADLATTLTVLQSTQSQICNQPGCGSTPSSASSVSMSFFLILASIMFFLF